MGGTRTTFGTLSAERNAVCPTAGPGAAKTCQVVPNDAPKNQGGIQGAHRAAYTHGASAQSTHA
eukprot:5993225-Amphidinium_carterae.1